MVALVGAVCLVIYRAATMGGSSAGAAGEEQPPLVDSLDAGLDTLKVASGPERAPEELASGETEDFLVLGEDVFRGENSFTLTRYVRAAEGQPNDSLRALLQRQYREIIASHERDPSRLAIYVFGPEFRMGNDTSRWTARLIQEGGGPVKTVVKE